jgi:hypothetical protein
MTTRSVNEASIVALRDNAMAMLEQGGTTTAKATVCGFAKRRT